MAGGDSKKLTMIETKETANRQSIESTYVSALQGSKDGHSTECYHGDDLCR